MQDKNSERRGCVRACMREPDGDDERRTGQETRGSLGQVAGRQARSFARSLAPLQKGAPLSDAMRRGTRSLRLCGVRCAALLAARTDRPMQSVASGRKQWPRDG